MVIETASAGETQDLGYRIGKSLKPKDVVALFGTLGAGKTTLVQGIARALDIVELVTSPTFVLINEYQGLYPLYHIDLYRLDDLSQIDELGIAEYFTRDGITLIEWAEKMGRMLPRHVKEIKIEYLDDHKRKFITNFDF